ncbi:MAG: type II secretion system F family protein [Lachnospiraceae bacterium]|nr:type II secretion system F family protein [Lachnospiraceae bacterium]MDY5496712.1 type II secretion system F family protein [Anaerobutyricum sp.]
MGTYRYIAQTAEGKKVRGVLEAANPEELHQNLKDGNLFLLSAKEQKSKKNRKKPFKTKTLADFSRQLSTLVGAGVTLVRAIGIIAKGKSVKPRERAVYDDILTKIRQGIPLSEAMEAQDGVFPELMIHMYRSAEAGGNLEQVSLKMAELYEKEHRLQGKISSSMIYPKILLVMILAVILILTKFVLPEFKELFDQMERLPLPTRILNHISYVMEHHWILVLAVLFFIWGGGKILLRAPSVRARWHKLLLHLPVIGNLEQVICTSRFARTLSSLYSAGIPIVTALGIARKTSGNLYIEDQFDEVISFVKAGNNLSDSLEMVDGFVNKLSDTIRVGEETGSLDRMLVSTADALEFDADMAINKMVSLVEPTMLIVMGFIVAFVMIAVFSALYGSYDAISNMG